MRGSRDPMQQYEVFRSTKILFGICLTETMLNWNALIYASEMSAYWCCLYAQHNRTIKMYNDNI